MPRQAPPVVKEELRSEHRRMESTSEPSCGSLRMCRFSHVEQCRLAVRSSSTAQSYALSRVHHRASQTDEVRCPVPGVDQAVQTDAAVPAAPALAPGQPLRLPKAPAPAPAPAVPVVAAGDHPLAAEFAAILDAEWPAYSDRTWRRCTRQRMSRARRRDAGVPPALVDIRREQSPAQVVNDNEGEEEELWLLEELCEGLCPHDAAAHGFPSAWGTASRISW